MTDDDNVVDLFARAAEVEAWERRALENVLAMFEQSFAQAGGSRQ